MKKYSKPIGNLLNYKQSFFADNDKKLVEYKEMVKVYNEQPLRTHCKMCNSLLDMGKQFTKGGMACTFCPVCGHCNGIHEDTKEYCEYIYNGPGGAVYSENYTAEDKIVYEDRVKDIYLPKAEFLKSAVGPGSLADFGAGAGYFVSAATSLGFENVVGYDTSPQMVQFGNAIMGREALVQTSLDSILPMLRDCRHSIVSMIGVLEHLQYPREALQAISGNSNVRYFFFSVPLFSPTVVIEAVFQEVMPRHLSGRHTHLFTKSSIHHFCNEFGFSPIAEWWFGLDVMDIYRSVFVALREQGNEVLRDYWGKTMFPILDELQSDMDTKEICSEVHMVLKKVG